MSRGRRLWLAPPPVAHPAAFPLPQDLTLPDALQARRQAALRWLDARWLLALPAQRLPAPRR